MATGTVDTVDPRSGHGTIAPDSRGEPIYFVMDLAHRPLRPGDHVTYAVQVTPGGVVARNVRPTLAT